MKQDNDFFFSAMKMTSMMSFAISYPHVFWRIFCVRPGFFRLPEKFCEAAVNCSVNICFHDHGLTYFLFIYLQQISKQLLWWKRLKACLTRFKTCVSFSLIGETLVMLENSFMLLIFPESTWLDIPGVAKQWFFLLPMYYIFLCCQI